MPGPGISLKSDLIDKSPLIGSIARTLTCDDSRMETTTATRYSSKRSVSAPDTGDAEEDWRLLVTKLLSASDLDSESLSGNPLCKWHSMQSPLDPSLRNKYAKTDDSETVNEAKRQRLSSNRKLVFDLVNSLLAELTTEYDKHLVGVGKGNGSTTLGEHVRMRMRELFIGSGQVHCWDEDGDLSSLAVDRAARAEAAEGGWPENKRREIDNVGEELERKMVEELVEEAITDLTQMITGNVSLYY